MAPLRPARVTPKRRQSAPFTVWPKVKSRTLKVPDFGAILPGTSLVCGGPNRYLAWCPTCEPPSHARRPRHRHHRPRPLCLAFDRVRHPFLADRVQCREHAQPVRRRGGRIPVSDHRAVAGADQAGAARHGRARPVADRPDPDHHVHPAGDRLLHLSQRDLTSRADGLLMDPWRYSTEGISIALRVTARGGRDDIDGIETLANGRSVVKVRDRAIAEGGEANRAVMELLAKALGVPKARVRILSGTTSRMKPV